MVFKSSINIKFDIGNEEFVKRYMPTPSHANALNSILHGLNGKGNRSHIIIGPYGTGKSLIGTLVANISSKKINSDIFDLLKNKFQKVYDGIYSDLEHSWSDNTRFLPVILNGYEGSFRQVVISSIMKTLHDHGINHIYSQSIVKKILEIVDTWKNKYPETYQKFLTTLEAQEKELESWLFQIECHSDEEINWFKGIFPKLTSGAELTVNYEETFTDQITNILKQLKQEKLGLFIIYDEFGRFLQDLNSRQEVNQAMQDIQNLAEQAESNELLHLLLITHKHLRHYFYQYNAEDNDTFEKVEERFVSHYIENDNATFIRIAHNIIQDNYNNYSLKESGKQGLIKNLRRYNLFPELNQVELESLVVKGTYPIHPVTLYLLPLMSTQFGQNERTLFTFLDPNTQKRGLKQLIKKSNNSYFTPDMLFEFFFPEVDVTRIKDEDKSTILRIYKKHIERIPGLQTPKYRLSSAILKFITLWQICGLRSRQKLSTDFITFALDKKKSNVNEALEYLNHFKAIRYNHVYGYWEVFEGSSINIEAEISERLEEKGLSENNKLKILKSHLPKKYYLSHEYNDIKSMTRFASINLILSTDIIEKGLNILKDKSTDADVKCYMIILNQISDYQRVMDLIEKINDDLSVYCVPNFTYNEIDKTVREYNVVEELLDNQDFLMQDPEIGKELNLKNEELGYKIRGFLKRYFDHFGDLKWIYNGETLSIANEIQLENYISNLMFEIYGLTPEVRNDSFNRRHINRVQKRAAYNVIDGVLKYPYIEGFNIEGKGPDYLIYATMFKNNSLSISNLDTLSNGPFTHIRSDLLDVLGTNSRGTLANLVNVLEKPPYGIRKPLIPIYLISLLRDKWDNLMFYKNDLYISNINGEKWYEMIDEPESYQYIYYQFDKEYLQFFNYIKDKFSVYIDQTIDKMPIHRIVINILLHWLRSLPRYTQITTKLNKDAKLLKDIVRKMEVEPYEAIDLLYNKYQNDFSQIVSDKYYLEELLNKKKNEIRKNIFDEFTVSSFESLQKAIHALDQSIQKSSRICLSIMRSKQDSWIDDLVYDLVGVNLEEWSDNTEEMFYLQVKQEIKSLDEDNLDDYIKISIDDEVKIIPKDIELSPKSKTIYSNVQRIIKNGGRTVPEDEIKHVIVNLLNEFVK